MYLGIVFPAWDPIYPSSDPGKLLNFDMFATKYGSQIVPNRFVW